MQDVKPTINSKIKEYITEHGITQKFLIDKTGISQEKISNIVNDKRKITGEELLLISRALDVNPNIFLD